MTRDQWNASTSRERALWFREAHDLFNLDMDRRIHDGSASFEEAWDAVLSCRRRTLDLEASGARRFACALSEKATDGAKEGT